MKTKTKTQKPASKAKSTKTTLAVLLLDRSGSIQQIKTDLIGGFNTYLDGLGESIRCSATQFDSQGIDTIFTDVSPKKATRLTDENFVPRGSTPLYDAIGKVITDTMAVSKDKKIVFTILTDGLENASHEWDYTKVKALMKEREEKDHWTFAFIGAGQEAWDQTSNLASGLRSASNVANISSSSTGKQMRMMAQATSCYAASMLTDNAVMTNYFAGHNADQDAE